jgi:hypothetical protein
MKLLLATMLMMTGVAAPAATLHAQSQQADPFVFNKPGDPPMRIEGTGLALERVSPPDKPATADIGYVELSTMRRQGDVVDVWVLIVLPERTRLDKIEADAVWASLRFDCAANTTQNRANGAVLANGTITSRDNNEDAPEPTKASSNASEVAAIACGRVTPSGKRRYGSVGEAVTATRKR